MKLKLLIFILTFTISYYGKSQVKGTQELSCCKATCIGANPCRACTTCSSCKYCKTGSCGACTRSSKPEQKGEVNKTQGSSKLKAYAKCRASTLKVRINPSDTSSILELIRNEEKLTVVQESGGWVEVMLPSGQFGYVKKEEIWFFD